VSYTDVASVINSGPCCVLTATYGLCIT